jgi:hypothetical protein
MNQQPRTQQEILAHGFQGFPEVSKLPKMSAADLAILLAQQHPPGKAGYILVEHHLNMRIAKEQSGATWKAGVLGAVGGFAFAIMGPVLTAYLQNPQAKQQEADRHPSELRPQQNLGVQPPPIIAAEPFGKTVKPPSASAPTVPAPNATHAASNPKP